METQAPILMKIATDPDYAYDSRDFYIQRIDEYLGKGEWTEVPIDKFRHEWMNSVNPKYGEDHIFMDRTTGERGRTFYYYCVGSSNEPAWIHCPEEEVYWIRLDIMVELDPNWGIDYILKDF